MCLLGLLTELCWFVLFVFPFQCSSYFSINVLFCFPVEISLLYDKWGVIALVSVKIHSSIVEKFFKKFIWTTIFLNVSPLEVKCLLLKKWSPDELFKNFFCFLHLWPSGRCVSSCDPDVLSEIWDMTFWGGSSLPEIYLGNYIHRFSHLKRVLS